MGLAKPVNYIATEVGNHDIRVNGITPGYVFTDRHIQEIELKVKSAYKTEEDVAQSKMKLQQIS